MIITRTPFRVSFFGDGTDYPEWYTKNGGDILTTTINKYCYISCRYLPPFFEHQHSIVSSYIKNVKKNSEIQHPALKAILMHTNIAKGVAIHHNGDLPAGAGLGSSSSFTVGLLHALSALQGKMITQEDLANDAIHVEQNLIGEHIGSQNQISVAFGGFNHIKFHRNGTFKVSPVSLSTQRRNELRSHLMLCFIGFSHITSDIKKHKSDNPENCSLGLNTTLEMVQEAISILQNRHTPIEEFGKLLGQCQEHKSNFFGHVSTSKSDRIYNQAVRAGAIGGKLLGAGDGGFMLLFASPEKQASICERLNKLVHVPFKFDNSGSQVVLYQPNGL